MRATVGVIIATYNRAHSVAQAIESALGQTYSNLQVIVVDDGSTDDTQAMLRTYARDERVRLVRHESNFGAAAAFNTGISHLGEAQLFALLGSDDALLPEAVETLVRVFETSADEHSMAIGWAQDMHSWAAAGRMTHLPHREGLITYDDALAGRFVGDFWILARCDLLGDIRFEERARGGEGSVWWRLLRQRPGWLVPIVVLDVDRTGADRLSLPVYTPASSAGMMWAQKAMLDAIGGDLRRTHPERYGATLVEMAKWAALAGDGRGARAASRESLRVAPSRRGLLTFLLSFLSPSILRRIIDIRSHVRRFTSSP